MGKKTFLWLRLAACGAIVGIAIGNLLAQHLGVHFPLSYEASSGVSALIGAGTTAALVKAIHIV